MNASRALTRSIVNFRVPSSTIVRRAASNGESYTERQEKLGRPVSPHVTIYAFPPAALTSITNRVTGVGLSAGMSCSLSVLSMVV